MSIPKIELDFLVTLRYIDVLRGGGTVLLDRNGIAACKAL